MHCNVPLHWKLDSEVNYINAFIFLLCFSCKSVKHWIKWDSMDKFGQILPTLANTDKPIVSTINLGIVALWRCVPLWQLQWGSLLSVSMQPLWKNVHCHCNHSAANPFVNGDAIPLEIHLQIYNPRRFYTKGDQKQELVRREDSSWRWQRRSILILDTQIQIQIYKGKYTHKCKRLYYDLHQKDSGLWYVRLCDKNHSNSNRFKLVTVILTSAQIYCWPPPNKKVNRAR